MVKWRGGKEERGVDRREERKGCSSGEGGKVLKGTEKGTINMKDMFGCYN